VAFGEENDVWGVNADPDYQEEIRLQVALQRVFAKLDRFAFGIAVGALAALLLPAASLFLVIKGGHAVGHNLRLLGEYLPGYEASPRGALLGLLYGFFGGFAAGWLFAITRNAAALFSLAVIRRRVQSGLLRRVFDYV
jgi:hypothetical protein